MAKTIVSIGDLVLDIVAPVKFPVRRGDHQRLPDCLSTPGGAANFILTARNLGIDVVAVGAVGSDTHGEAILRPLRERGVDTRYVAALPDSTSTLVLTLTDRSVGEHVFLGHYGEGPDVPYPDGLDAVIEKSDAVFLMSYTLLEKRVLALAVRALEHAYKVGIPIYLDAGPLIGMADQEQVKWALQHTHLFFLTDEEAPLVTQGLQSDNAYASLMHQGPKYAVVKHGPKGCTVVTNDWWLANPAFAVEKVTDTVGAGDCFDAAFLAGLLHGLEMEQCAQLANATGSVNAQKIGAGVNAPTAAEIRAVLDKAGEQVAYPWPK
ncbi:MAG: carbohydrate kinase family protein [Chloroflexi bacterium]|nr:carbohydrate kinase family protein [Chloroflexota bacterium]